MRDLKRAGDGSFMSPTLPYPPEDEDDLCADEQEQLEETLVDQATAAKTLTELEAEVLVLQALKQMAMDVVVSGRDRKWEELSKILQEEPVVRDASGRVRKLIVFTEHRDTLTYLHQKVGNVIGIPEAVVAIHGGTPRDERRKIQEAFRVDPNVRVLVATDAAGEGVNLQTANLMVNYDLPWNPNRLEQRFGRIHRIGQREVCHLWSLVAGKTREGQVYRQLLDKLAAERSGLQGQVFDILGEVFEETSLKDLLLSAIRYGDQPEVQARLHQKVDSVFDIDHLRAVLARTALAQESMTAERLFTIKEDMERAEARRLQPFFVRSFFLKAFKEQNGSIYPREPGRFEITFVPEAMRQGDATWSGRSQRNTTPVVKRYERVCFAKEDVPPKRQGQASASMIHPGHPLMLAVLDVVLKQHANLLRQGAILVDPADHGTNPHLLLLMTHEVRSGDDQALSKQLQFVRIWPDGTANSAGFAPHLDLQPIEESDRKLVDHLVREEWIHENVEPRAVAIAAASLVPEHLRDVSERHVAQVDKTLRAVQERLSKEIDHWTERWMKAKDDVREGKDARLNVENAQRMVMELAGRLDRRRAELQTLRHVTSATPLVLGGAVVIPQGLLCKLRGDSAPVGTFSQDASARRRIEEIAMRAVTLAEEARGHRVRNVASQKCGWDLTSYPPMEGGKQLEPRHIEVKGRAKGATTLTVTRNELLCALNQGDKYHLAMVFVGEDDSVDGPHYVQNPFDTEPGWGVSSVNFDVNALLAREGVV